MKKKTIILIIPVHFYFYEELVTALERNGFNVALLFITDTPFSYQNLLQRVKSFVHKNILFDKNYKKALIYNVSNMQLIQALHTLKFQADYALVFRSDLISPEALSILRNKADTLVAYQWDGLERFPEVFKRIPLFDRFFVFDKYDYEAYKSSYENISLTTNFYFDQFPRKSEQLGPSSSMLFVGSYLENRMPDILNLVEYLDREGYEVDIRLLCTKKDVLKKYEGTVIKFIATPLTYSELMGLMDNASIVLDFDNSLFHKGLSFRVFESLYFKKKLITSNTEVVYADFYNPNNIFVWNADNLESIKEFLKKPMVDISESVVEKYSFSNWITHLLK